MGPSYCLRSEDANFLDTLEAEYAWDEESAFTRILLHDPQNKSAFHKIDLFHTVSLGVGKSHAASSLCILQILAPGTSVDQRLKEISSHYIEFCKEFGSQCKYKFLSNTPPCLIVCSFISMIDQTKKLLYSGSTQFSKEHKKVNYVQKIDRALLGWQGSKEPTGGWSKGALTTTICQFCDHFCKIHNLAEHEDERFRLIAT